MQIAVASFEYEGNSLSLKLDGKADFARKTLCYGSEVLTESRGRALAIAGGIDQIERAGYSVLPIAAAKCVSGGHVEDGFFHEMHDRIVHDVKTAMPLDGVYLALHGAMICQTVEDPEGALLESIRATVGPDIPIAASLDLHAHVTEKMVANATVLVGYETYPHEDAFETGARAASLLVGTLKGDIRPTMRMRKINAIFPVLGGRTDGDAPMAAVRKRARDFEKTDGVLSVSYFPVQPWLDYATVGVTAVAITDAARDATGTAAHDIATTIVTDMWARRHAFELPAFSPAAAVREALAQDVDTSLIIDTPDSIGGGASGDAPAVLAALLDLAPDVTSIVCLVDPASSARAHEAGVGATCRFRIGAGLDARFHNPVSLEAEVDSVHKGDFVYTGGPAGGVAGSLGPSAVLRRGGMRIIVASYPVYEHMDEHLRACGIDYRQFRIAVFKNLMNYNKLLGPRTRSVAVHGPGSTPLRLQDVVWKNRRRPFWPADDTDAPVFLDDQHDEDGAPEDRHRN